MFLEPCHSFHTTWDHILAWTCSIDDQIFGFEIPQLETEAEEPHTVTMETSTAQISYLMAVVMQTPIQDNYISY